MVDWKRRLKDLGLGRTRGRTIPGASTRPRSRHLETGRAGEAEAAAYLEAAGVEILARNVRYLDGELDLVARDGTTVTFVEVKTRRSAKTGTPAESVTWRKRARVVRAALRWLDETRGGGGAPIRFDVVAVTAAPMADPPLRSAGARAHLQIEWIKGAFDAHS